MMDSSLRARLATEGVGVIAPVSRRGGAGPTDDGHMVIDGSPAAVPFRPASSFQVVDGRLHLDSVDLGIEVETVGRPHFYDQVTSDGTPMHKLARLHGADVLATTVVQTCIRYAPDQRCRYCSIEESLYSGVTTRVKTPAQLAEVATAAVRLDGVRHMVMTTGTAATADRGARHLARCVAAVKEAVPYLAVQVQCEPPDDPEALGLLRRSGADSIGIHVESLDDAVRTRWMPGKAQVPLSSYWAAWGRAVELFGRNQVSTYLLVGLGENPDEMVAGAEKLIGLGVYPFVVPVRPGTGTLAAADGLVDPPAELVSSVTARVADLLEGAAMRGSDQAAGCAACGACSALGGGRSVASPVTLRSRVGTGIEQAPAGERVRAVSESRREPMSCPRDEIAS